MSAGEWRRGLGRKQAWCAPSYPELTRHFPRSPSKKNPPYLGREVECKSPFLPNVSPWNAFFLLNRRKLSMHTAASGEASEVLV